MTAPTVTTPAPALESFAALLYDALAPLAGVDGDNDWHLAHYCAAIGEMFQSVADVARDTEDGPGWSAVVDLTRCPDTWLPWLAQFVGVSIPTGTTPNAAEKAIAARLGFQRGTPAAIRAAAQATLTGTGTVVFQERLGGDAYALGVYTLTTETPDVAKTRAAILSQKPGGITLDYSAGAGNTYQAVKVGHATYADVKSAYPDYQHMAAGITP